jgi:dihydroorotate dehydrogenase (NAD+) catalytic subunit
MIELAPNHKRGLNLRAPVMSATGIVGYSDAYRQLFPLESLGAIITNPITARARQGAPPPRVISMPGGLLMHTGLDNPGVSAVLRRHRRRWTHSLVPVIAHVVGVNADETFTCVERLSALDVLAGLELGLPDSLLREEAEEIVLAARSACTLPLIIKLPLWRATDWAVLGIESGQADALTVAAPPRGTLWYHDRAITGRLYGPATFPQALWALRQVVQRVEGAVPLIGCGGVHSIDDALAMLAAGAAAVQVDSFVWKDPAAFGRLAQALADMQREDTVAEG